MKNIVKNFIKEKFYSTSLIAFFISIATTSAVLFSDVFVSHITIDINKALKYFCIMFFFTFIVYIVTEFFNYYQLIKKVK